MLLKQALYLARRDYAAIYNALSGIIFLGTPHLTSADDERWERWRLILKLFRKDVPKTAVSRQDAEMLVKVFERFNGLNLRISVISVYETKETKMKDKGPIDRIRGVGKMVCERIFSIPFSEPKAVTNWDTKLNSLWTAHMQPLRWKMKS